jgi:hypothetical protein
MRFEKPPRCPCAGRRSRVPFSYHGASYQKAQDLIMLRNKDRNCFSTNSYAIPLLVYDQS